MAESMYSLPSFRRLRRLRPLPAVARQGSAATAPPHRPACWPGRRVGGSGQRISRGCSQPMLWMKAALTYSIRPSRVRSEVISRGSARPPSATDSSFRATLGGLLGALGVLHQVERRGASRANNASASPPAPARRPSARSRRKVARACRQAARCPHLHVAAVHWRVIRCRPRLVSVLTVIARVSGGLPAGRRACAGDRLVRVGQGATQSSAMAGASAVVWPGPSRSAGLRASAAVRPRSHDRNRRQRGASCRKQASLRRGPPGLGNCSGVELGDLGGRRVHTARPNQLRLQLAASMPAAPPTPRRCRSRSRDQDGRARAPAETRDSAAPPEPLQRSPDTTDRSDCSSRATIRWCPAMRRRGVEASERAPPRITSAPAHVRCRLIDSQPSGGASRLDALTEPGRLEARSARRGG